MPPAIRVLPLQIGFAALLGYRVRIVLGVSCDDTVLLLVIGEGREVENVCHVINRDQFQITTQHPYKLSTSVFVTSHLE